MTADTCSTSVKEEGAEQPKREEMQQRPQTTTPGSTQEEAKQMPASIHNGLTVVDWGNDTDIPREIANNAQRRNLLFFPLLQASDTGRFIL